MTRRQFFFPCSKGFCQFALEGKRKTFFLIRSQHLLSFLVVSKHLIERAFGFFFYIEVRNQDIFYSLRVNGVSAKPGLHGWILAIYRCINRRLWRVTTYM
jgi:hypothetical protein